MDNQLEQRLANIEKLVSDNNRMLIKMRGAQKRAAYVRALYWVVIIGLTIASFYFIQPYISQFGAAYGLGGGTSTNTSDTSSPSTTQTLLNLVKQYQADQKTAQ
ncbi:MAG: hypothetical protein JWL92_488 [Candidatus Nomurabacteria bacterium]|nr:hypothetical protein [Candidatus Nomurabacteria bacterium]